MLVYGYINRFHDIFPWPNFFQAYCALLRSNMVIGLRIGMRNWCVIGTGIDIM